MNIQETADLIWAGRSSGDRNPESLRGKLTAADAYKVQQTITDRLLARGDRITGWKIAGNSERFRKVHNGAKPISAPLFASTALANFSRVDVAALKAVAKLESELFFVVKQRLSGPRISREMVRDAIDTVAPAYEIPFMGASLEVPLCIAAHGNNIAYVTGKALPSPRDMAFGELAVEERRNGEITQQGLPKDAMDEHIDSIARLAEHLHTLGQAIEKGHGVLSGNVFPTAMGVAKGDRYVTTFQSLGNVGVEFV